MRELGLLAQQKASVKRIRMPVLRAPSTMINNGGGKAKLGARSVGLDEIRFLRVKPVGRLEASRISLGLWIW